MKNYRVAAFLYLLIDYTFTNETNVNPVHLLSMPIFMRERRQIG